METKNTMGRACPNLIFNNIDTTFNKLIETPEGWKFWRHTDPDGKVTNVQFCKLIGRKHDVFECINKSEWENCSYIRDKEATNDTD